METLAFSPDGHLLASGALHSQVRLWIMSSGQEFSGPRIRSLGECDDLAFAPDGRHIAVATGGKVVVGEVKMDGRIATLKDDSAFRLAFSRDGTSILVADRRGTVRQWDPEARQVISQFTGAQDIRSFAYSPANNTMALGDSEGRITLRVVDARQPSRSVHAHATDVCATAFSPDGNVLVSAGRDKFVCSWDVATQRLLWKLNAPLGCVEQLRFSPTGEYFGGVSSAGVVVWGARTAAERLRRQDHRIRAIAFSPEGKLLACSGYRTRISVLDLDTGKDLAFPGLEDSVLRVQFALNDTSLVTQDGEKNIYVTRRGRKHCRRSGSHGSLGF